ncbi:tetratricopeptide repeat protein [Sediminitomix flava]|uniref:Tetratricopeptide repeat protein n=1 Tax=Sediminitomix flava TaxID=379075 RepID=A0A315Z6E9_SEDFL|nr:tetratricopeptide repeat protein [Sediminitomix flava]PWJ38550.1 tetratricopeptide repeat protein [Sediminitomix flava]
MKFLNYLLLPLSLIAFHLTSCSNTKDKEEKVLEANAELSEQQEAIIEKYVVNGANKHPLYSQERQAILDKGLAEDSTIAYLWQQKAMPLFKQGKYEIGMDYIDKAVKYDRKRWQDYRAFIKCIFAKTYRDAISDFQDYKQRYGDGYVMDHTYDFYIGVSYLQLDEFQKAEEVFEADYQKQISAHDSTWLHPVDLFYYGISKYELGKYQEANEIFDSALKIYPEFSDVQYYKAFCLVKLERLDNAKQVYQEAQTNGSNGYTLNEDNAIYERYPYQVRW